MSSIIKIAPIFKEKMWGGTRLQEKYGFDIPSEKTGECWVVAAHPDGDCTVETGVFKGQPLSKVYKENRDLFGDCEHDDFPLLVKIIDAHKDLSIQVHPDDAMAKNLGLPHGKAEAWLILDGDEKSELIVGHTCKTREELEQALNSPTQFSWLQRFHVRPNQFYYLPGGTVHAVGASTMVYEIEQNSNVAYRIYDYERYVGDHKRDLHLEQALEAIKVPDLKREAIPQRIITNTMKHTFHLRSEHFVVQRFEIDEDTTLQQDQMFVVLGFLTEGSVNGVKAKAGDHFIALNNCSQLHLTAGSTVIATYIPRKC
jgi:mannose-6-phosphate isomerase